MTIVGKMMAIGVLVLSILQGGLTVMLFVARSNWVNQTKVLTAQVAASNASAVQYQAEAEAARADAKGAEAILKAQVAKQDQELKAQLQQNAGLDKQLSDQTVKTREQIAVAQAAQRDAALRQVDNDRMLGVVKERDVQIANLVTENKKEREDRVNAEIQRTTAILSSQKMEEKLREAVKEIAKRGPAGSGGGTPSVSAKPNMQNPPAETIEGLVAEADSTGLMELTIGSDAGLKEGHTLELFRIAAIPQQSQYLGMVRIRKVSATKAVAEPVGRLAAPPRPGDHVSSRILGGGN